MNATVSKRVLVIDDDPVVGTSFERVLAPKGYDVSAAADGADAFARLARDDYDVVYTDLKMPGMDGMEVARRIRASRPWMPVVIVTGYGTTANEAEAKELGVSAFLHKPLSPEMIEDVADRVAFEAEREYAKLVRKLAVPSKAEATVEVTTTPAPATTPLTIAKNVGLFFIAPFVALGYVVLGPFVGLGIAGWMAVKALRRKANG